MLLIRSELTSSLTFAQESATSTASDIDWLVLLMTLFGGLAVFLLGMDRLTEALKLVAGDRLRTLLARLTTNRFMGVLTGASVTAFIQSSSVTTVLVVGFVTSGLLTLSQAIGVIMGANIGTTVTAQIIAFKVTKYALGVVAIGFGVSFFSKNESRRSLGAMLMGLGLIFYGMGVMADAMEPLRSYEPFVDLMSAMKNPFLGILVAALFTALVQSSSATTGIVIVLATQGLISLEAAVALILGANIGTSVTAGLAAIGKPRDAQRAALVHALFNTIGVLLALPLIGVLTNVVENIGGGLAREVANAHAIFNVANMLVFIGFTGHLAALAVRLLPDRAPEDEWAIQAKHLDTELLRTPSLALDRARLEMLRMASRVKTMLREVLPAMLDGPGAALTELENIDDEVDGLHAHIIGYLGEVSKNSLSQRDTEEVMRLMTAANNLEAMGDLIETNLVGLGRDRLDRGVVVSPDTRRVLDEFHAAVVDAFDRSIVAVSDQDPEEARAVSAMKEQINALELAASVHQASRLIADEPNRLEAYRFEMDVITNLKRLYYFAKRTARVAVPVAEQADT